MKYFTKAQADKYSELIAHWTTYKSLTPADYVYIETLACILDQIAILQAQINREGSTYRTTTAAGVEYVKEHPAQRHLGQCRAQAAVIAQKLAKGVDQQIETDELDAFLNSRE